MGEGAGDLDSVRPALASLSLQVVPQPQHPLWANSRVQPSGLLELSPQNPGLQRSQLGPSTCARHVHKACAWERLRLKVRVGPSPPIYKLPALELALPRLWCPPEWGQRACQGNK